MDETLKQTLSSISERLGIDVRRCEHDIEDLADRWETLALLCHDTVSGVWEVMCITDAYITGAGKGRARFEDRVIVAALIVLAIFKVILESPERFPNLHKIGFGSYESATKLFDGARKPYPSPWAKEIDEILREKKF